MNEQHYRELNADLGMEFDLFAVEHPDWMAQNVPQGAIVVLQTDDADFNAWSREIAQRNRHLETPPRPIVLVHICEIRPQKSRIVRAEATLIAS